MKHLIVIGACAIALSLTGCSNNPEEASDAAASDVRSIPLDAPAPGDQADTSTDENGPADTMIRGGGDTAGTTPPKDSKLQRAD